jgi:hypothetical protein
MSNIRFNAADARRRGMHLARLWFIEQYLALRSERNRTA